MYRQAIVWRIKGHGENHAPRQHGNERPNQDKGPIEQEGQQREANRQLDDLVPRFVLPKYPQRHGANPIRLIGTPKRRRFHPSQSLPSRPEAIAACASLRLIWIKHQRRSIILSDQRPAEHLAREEIGSHFSCRNALIIRLSSTS